MRAQSRKDKSYSSDTIVVISKYHILGMVRILESMEGHWLPQCPAATELLLRSHSYQTGNEGMSTGGLKLVLVVSAHSMCILLTCGHDSIHQSGI